MFDSYANLAIRAYLVILINSLRGFFRNPFERALKTYRTIQLSKSNRVFPLKIFPF